MSPGSTRRTLDAGIIVGRARLASGLVLFTYVTLHFVNHATGLYSIDAMEATNAVFASFWRSLPMTVLLYGALAVHVASAFHRLATRNTWRLPYREWVQIGLGLAIPLLLVTHVMGTRFASAVYGISDSYPYVLLSIFVFAPLHFLLNVGGLIAAWAHACIGLHQWLRIRPWYTTIVHEWTLAFAILLPVSALAGVLAGAREVAPLVNDGEYMEGYYARLNLPGDRFFADITSDINVARALIIGLLCTLLLVQLVRYFMNLRGARVEIDYLDGPRVSQPAGLTLLEISNASGVPHASICGGRGRCSTCRVRVLNQDRAQDLPNDIEARLLRKYAQDGDVRLACQLRPKGRMSVLRMLPSDASLREAHSQHPGSMGQERPITVMFADLRDFTKTSETRLPFDVVYLINQFSEVMGKQVEAHGGRIDKFLGDGFMALFGLETNPEEAAAAAIDTAAAMVGELSLLNERLKNDLDLPLRMGIGLHSGPVVLGEMGYSKSRQLTAIGDTVNTASRLEAATKELACSICVSKRTAELAGRSFRGLEPTHIDVRGKSRQVAIYAVTDTALMVDVIEKGDEENA